MLVLRAGPLVFEGQRVGDSPGLPKNPGLATQFMIPVEPTEDMVWAGHLVHTQYPVRNVFAGQETSRHA